MMPEPDTRRAPARAAASISSRAATSAAETVSGGGAAASSAVDAPFGGIEGAETASMPGTASPSAGTGTGLELKGAGRAPTIRAPQPGQKRAPSGIEVPQAGQVGGARRAAPHALQNIASGEAGVPQTSQAVVASASASIGRGP